MKKVIRFFYYTLFALTPLIMSSKTSEMFEFNKMIVIYATSIIIAGLYGIYYLIKRPQIIFPLPMFVYLFFLGVLSLATYFSIDRHTSIYGYYGRWNGGLLSIISYISLLFVFIQTFNKIHLKRLLLISLISSTFVILWGVPGWFGYDLSCLLFTGALTNTCWTAQFAPHVRMFSTLGQPNWLGAYLAIHFFIGLYFLISSLGHPEFNLRFGGFISGSLAKMLKPFGRAQGRRVWHDKLTIVYFFYILLNLFALYATKSKSAWYAVVLAIGIGAVFLFSQKIKKSIRHIFIFSSIALMILATASILIFGSSLYARNVPDNLEITDSFTIRTYVWQGAIDLWKKYPVFGTGPETFAYSYYFTKPAEHSRSSEWDFIYNKAHNEFLHYLATTGSIGFIGYVGVVVAALILLVNAMYKKRKNRLSFFLLFSYATILVTNFFGFSTSTIQLFFYLIPGMIIVHSSKNQKRRHAECISASHIDWKTIKAQRFRIKFGMTMIAVIMFLMLGSVARMYWADILYTQAQKLKASEDYLGASNKLIDAMNLKYEHVYEDKLSTYLAHMAFINSFQSGADQNVLDIIDRSKVHNAQALAHSPQNILYWRSKARNYYLYYQVTQDVQDLVTAAAAMAYTTTIAPTDAQGYYMSALFYSVLFDETGDVSYQKQAQIFTKRALTLRPQYREARELQLSLQT